MRTYLVVFIVAIVQLASAQDTVFVSLFGDTLADRSKASHYIISSADPQSPRMLLRERYLPTGAKVGEERYVKGGKNLFRHGVWRSWHPNGVLKMEASCEADTLHGALRTWWPNGAPKRNDVYDKTTVVSKSLQDSLGNQLPWDFFEYPLEYPGGEHAQNVYLSRNTQYPSDALDAGKKGKVWVQLDIDADGKVVDAKVIKRVWPSMDKEAMRILRSMPNWLPPLLDGEPQPARTRIPIVFELM